MPLFKLKAVAREIAASLFPDAAGALEKYGGRTWD